MAEQEIFSSRGVEITSSRAVFGSKTYAVNQTTSVDIAKGKSSSIVLLALFVGALYALGSHNAFLGFLAALVMVGYMVLVRRHSTLKIITSAGEVRAFASWNRKLVERIVQALNDSIATQG